MLLKSIKHYFSIRRIIIGILRNEYKSYTSNLSELEQSCIEHKMLVLVHALEKGMGIKNPRVRYGQEKAKELISLISKYKSCGYLLDNFTYQESIALLKKYFDLMNKNNVDCAELKKEYDVLNCCEDISCEAGATLISYNELRGGVGSTFSRLVQTRHSMRMYSKEELSKDEIDKIVSIANMAPSACNRQPTHIYCTKTEKVSREFEQFIVGTHTFEGETPHYMVITTDRLYFEDDEFLQWYVNGGIYLGYLVLAMHSQGIGSIIMQWKFNNHNENNVKRMLGIPEKEAIVAIIGFGKNPPEGALCLCAQRKDIKEVIRYIE